MLPAAYRWPSRELLSTLVERAQRGSEGDVDRLLSAVRPALYAFFRQRTDGDAAEDLTQLTLLRIAGAVERIDHLRADAYLSAVARNLLRSTYKARARDRQRMTELDDDVDVPVESGAEMKSEYEDLARAVHCAALSMDQTALRDVTLGLLGGDSRAEVAERLAISPITVRTRLMRVRSLLRQRLPAYLEDLPIAR